jgi:rhamnogalacturonan endolyase
VIWWDGDTLREVLSANQISKWNWEEGKATNLMTAEGCAGGRPVLSGDLFGDWREEVIFRTLDSSTLRIYTTTCPTDVRLCTLMHDPQYRLSIAWQNVGYNQPPHPSYFLGHGMKLPGRPNIKTRNSAWQTSPSGP